MPLWLTKAGREASQKAKADGQAARDAKRAEKLKPVERSKELLKSQLEQLHSRPQSLGLSTSERDRMTDAVTRQATQQTATQQRAINQSALAGQDFQAGEFAQASADLGQQSAQAGAEAGSAAFELSTKLREARTNQILASLDAARERERQNAQFWGAQGIDTGQAAMSAGMSNIT